MDTFHCGFFFFSLSILTVLSLFAPVTSPTVSLPLSPSFCLGNTPHPTPGVQTGGAASGLLPAWVPAASEQPQPEPARPGTVRAEAVWAVPTDGTALTGRETHGLTPSPAVPIAGFCPYLFPWAIPPSDSRFGWFFFPGGDTFGVCYTANVSLTIISENSCRHTVRGFLFVSGIFPFPSARSGSMRLAVGFLFSFQESCINKGHCIYVCK